MGNPLRVLMVEDSEDDAHLLLRALKQAGFDVSHERVDTEKEMRAALEREGWQLVLSDWGLPKFSAGDALRVLKESGRDLPFIIVSGTVSEDIAVEAMKAGAHDFFNKQRLTRFLPAVTRELREAEIRRGHSKALARIQENERSLSAIFNQVAVGIMTTDLNGRVLTANDRFCEMVGRTKKEVFHLSVLDMAHPEERDATAASFAKAREGVGETVTGESRFLRKDDTYIWVSRAVSWVTDDNNRIQHAVAVIQDISARKKAEEHLKQAIQARDEFISIASHELKTPLTSLELQIESTLTMLRTRKADEVSTEKITTKLDMASRQVDRLTALVNNLLDVTRITSGRYALSLSKVDLGEIVRGAVARSQEVFHRAECQVDLTTEPDVTGMWDAIALETVVNNLLSNAAKFGAGKPVTITVRRIGSQAQLVVEDKGIGIAPEEQRRIFERFERAVPSQHYGGFGIGLWVSRQVIEAHGGTVRVQSVKGSGSVFTVELPIEPPQEAP